MKKNLPILILVAVILMAGSFYGGMKFQQGRAPSFARGQGNFANLNSTQRQQFVQNGGTAKGGQGNSMVAGEIIAKDDKSVTVKIKDNSAKIIFYSASTEIGKFEKSAAVDLAVGQNVSVNGQANSDGSVSAQNIQIRPAITASSTPIVK